MFERGSGVGGTWFWNRYPGARCDIESMDYSYSFSPELEQEWEWTERYPTQPEILRYLNHVADRFDLRRDIQLEHARDAGPLSTKTTNRWMVTHRRRRASSPRSYCIMAVGCLSSVNRPDFAGLENFTRPLVPHRPLAARGRRLHAVSASAASAPARPAIQTIPQIAKQAEHLFVFQRTPTSACPAHNAPLDAETQRQIKADYPERRQKARLSRAGLPLDPPTRSALEVSAEERQRVYEAGWRRAASARSTARSTICSISLEANETAAEFVRDKIRATVHDPAVAEMLLPKDYPFGTKRLCVDIDYFETYNRANVTLVDVRRDRSRRSPRLASARRSRSTQLDSIVFATGFDAMTGPLFDIDIRGRGGLDAEGQVGGRAADLSRPRRRLAFRTCS